MCDVSSAAVNDTLLSVSIALGLKSERFPIGVATTYNVGIIGSLMNIPNKTLIWGNNENACFQCIIFPLII